MLEQGFEQAEALQKLYTDHRQSVGLEKLKEIQKENAKQKLHLLLKEFLTEAEPFQGFMATEFKNLVQKCIETIT